MDWVAKLLGLDESFQCSSGVGGGIIMVRILSYSLHIRLTIIPGLRI